MEIARYLAMTPEEFRNTTDIPAKKAWMACHFSPYSSSLSNIPGKLPEGTLLILNDSTPPGNQDPEHILQELNTIIKDNHCSGLLLDFQRPEDPKSVAMVSALLQLDAPVCVSECYGKELNCPIFLPPLPITATLEEYIQPYKERQIWLDIALSCEKITVTSSGCGIQPYKSADKYPFKDTRLHCHYDIEVTEEYIAFTLSRTKDDLEELLLESSGLGVLAAVGLYQELK